MLITQDIKFPKASPIRMRMYPCRTCHSHSSWLYYGAQILRT